MENVEMLQRSFENYLRVKPGKITVDITLADGKTRYHPLYHLSQVHIPPGLFLFVQSFLTVLL